jgi:L-ascorbate metabolism protein UlaG (beta-lactamase superfamily)
MSIQETPEKNQVYFMWLNRYAGVTVKTPSTTVVIDPVDVKSKDFKSVDAILITHEHYDHLDQPLISEVQKQTDCMVIADRTSARKLRNVVPSYKLVEVHPGSEVGVESVVVKTEECNHPQAMSPVSFIVTSEDGVTLYHTADSLPFPEMTKISDREKLDVVFCTVGIASCASPQTGVDIARLTKPKVAVPYHTGSSSDQRKFAEILKNELPKIACLIPETGKIYEVSKRK